MPSVVTPQATTTGYTLEEASGKDFVDNFISTEHQKSAKNILRMALDGLEVRKRRGWNLVPYS
jgi:hypothetical protein